MNRVVVTGLGVVAPNGVGRETFWKACLAGRSGIGPISLFDAANHPVKIAGEIRDFDPAPLLPAESRKQLKIMSRAMKFGLGAAALALRDSGLVLDDLDQERIGVSMGTGIVPMDLGELAPMMARACDGGEFDASKLPSADGGSALFPLWLLKHLPNMTAAHISLAFGCQGPNSTITTACVAGTQAIGDAFRTIARGDADIMLAGGADSRIDPLLMMAYAALGTLSKSDRSPEEQSRPFDRLRQGFVLSEGAAVLVLETLEHAKTRGADIVCEVTGFGSSFDAYSATKPDPTGRGGSRAMRSALNEARVDPDEIATINAHGTSTRLNDEMETAAVKGVFGERAKSLKLSAIKSMIGHSIGAAGAIEAAALALTLKHRVYPPTINLTHPDPACDLDYVPNEAQDACRLRYGLSTSFGFGGQNGALVMKAA